MLVHNQTPGEGPFWVGVRGVDARKEGASLGGPMGRGSAEMDRKSTRQRGGSSQGQEAPPEVRGLWAATLGR